MDGDEFEERGAREDERRRVSVGQGTQGSDGVCVCVCTWAPLKNPPLLPSLLWWEEDLLVTSAYFSACHHACLSTVKAPTSTRLSLSLPPGSKEKEEEEEAYPVA